MHESEVILTAYQRGDLQALRRLLGKPPSFPDREQPRHLGGGTVLELAIYHSPLAFIRELLELGADANYPDHAGFPSLIAALSADREDGLELLELLLAHGADIQQRGVNDYTPLHYAANLEHLPAMALLIQHGADLNARTRIDDYATPLEEMENPGRTAAAAFLREAAVK